MTLEEKLKEIKERVDAATEGPWEQNQGFYVCTANKLPSKHGLLKHEITGAYGKTHEKFARRLAGKESVDHKFIAHARTDVPMLLMIAKCISDYIKAECNFHDNTLPHYLTQKIEKIIKEYS